MMRDSLKKYEDCQEMMRITMKGIDFYESYFKVNYPFNKYDQIFCPEYNVGAMENVGLVTYNESFIWKSPPTQRSKTIFAIIIIHELSHQWFGNLVTMDWWDDLWLNEAFATFISHLAMEENLKETYSISWLLFNYNKGNAYKLDQSKTTHPVMTQVDNTEQTETNFDTITYEKGSSILKQIYYLTGHEGFSLALEKYFNEYKYKNTKYSDFMRKLEEVCEGITPLADSWLKKSGLTEIECEYNQDENGRLNTFKVYQTPCLKEHNNLQTIITDILFIYEDKSLGISYKEFKKVVILPKSETDFTRNELFQNIPKPSAVIINYNDWGYAKLVIDKNSFSFFKNSLYKIESLITKQMIYRAFFDMLRDSRISGLEYIDLITNLLIYETHEEIISPQLGFLINAIESYIPIKYSSIYSDKLFKYCLFVLSQFPNNSDMTLTIINNILILAQTKPNLEILHDWMNQSEHKLNIEYEYDSRKISFPSVLFSQKIKLLIVKITVSTGFYDKSFEEKFIAEHISKDPNSSESNDCIMYCKGATREPELKEEIWKKIVYNGKSDTLYNMQSLMTGFVSKFQSDLIRPYLTKKYLEEIEYVSETYDKFYVDFFVNCFVPVYFVSEEIISKLEEKVNVLKEKKLEFGSRPLFESIDLMKRQLRSINLCYEYESKN